MKNKRPVLSKIWMMALCVFWIIPLGAAYAQADPSSRVARLNYFDGPVTFALAGSDDWAYAELNRPLTTGDQVWVDKGARSELHIGSAALQLGAQTSVSFSNLNDEITQLSVKQGVLSIRLRSLAPGQAFEIDTPNLAFNLQQPGDYRLNVDPNGQTTTIIVRAGSGVASGDNGADFSIEGQQEVVFSGTSLSQMSAADAPPYDSFDNWVRQRERREDQSVSARYVSREMTGYEELDDHGIWRDDPQYGYIWIPRVTVSNWAPYHSGHWAWIAPWGWTWIDDEPWGFAPFHYGRWAYVDTAWAWVPGPAQIRPVYAPALVAFVGGGGGGVSWSISLSSGNPGVAWFPLAPGELYRPAYTVSPAYVTNINKTVYVNKSVNVTNNITNVTNNNVTNNITKTVYINQQMPNAITAVSAAAFVKGQSVQAAAQPINAAQMSRAKIISSPAIAPVKESFMGAAKPAPLYTPPASVVNHPVIATRRAASPPALNDTLAQKFNARNGTAVGAGAPLVRQVSAITNRPAQLLSTPGNLSTSSIPHPSIGMPTIRKPNFTAARKVTAQSVNAGVSENGRLRPTPLHDVKFNTRENPSDIPHPPGAKVSNAKQPKHPHAVQPATAKHPIHPSDSYDSKNHMSRAVPIDISHRVAEPHMPSAAAPNVKQHPQQAQDVYRKKTSRSGHVNTVRKVKPHARSSESSPLHASSQAVPNRKQKPKPPKTEYPENVPPKDGQSQEDM